MTPEPAAGAEWYDDVTRRPGGYAQTWTQWTEGPDAQAQFDRLVLEASAGCEALDCGCGDGAFTLQVARVAAQVTGLDFSAGMLENARRAAAQAGAANVALVLSHARREVPLPPETFDLAYSRRGPNITVDVPGLVRPGGLLVGLHPLEHPSQAVRYAEGLSRSGLEVLQFGGHDDRLHFPALTDLAGYLNRFPGMPDLRRPEHRAQLLDLAAPLRQPDGHYVRAMHFLLWVAHRPVR